MMSIRIRQSGGMTIALCAAETDALPGDVYLDDAQHGALSAKFADDWQGQTVAWRHPEEWTEMAKHKLRDAEEELNRWLAAIADTRPEDGDVKQAPLASGGGAKQSPNPQSPEPEVNND